MFPIGMNKLKFLQNDIEPLSKSDRKFIKSIYQTKEVNIDKSHLSIWYRKNRYDINRIFSELMNSCNDNNIYILKPYQTFYNKFVEFCYKNSYLKIN